MASQGRHHTSHEIDIDAPPGRVYRIIADAARWPDFFGPTVHVAREALQEGAERLHIWATANGAVRSWTSRREFDEAARRVTFRQEVSTPPVAGMGGTWTVDERPGGGSRLVLTHDFDAVGDTAENVAWVERATDRNSRTELGNIKDLAERWERLGELLFSFEDSVVVEGPAEAAYDFLHQAKKWPDRLPHVTRLDLTEDVPDVQLMSMDTLAADGSTHRTESVRVCFPEERRIVYKQLVPPSLMAAHTGEWSMRESGRGVRVTSRHTVVVKEEAVVKVLGPDATLDTARNFIRAAAGGNSMATLTLLKESVESGRA
ncbi:actinorhodin polyketide synthase bifunctional cyclase/dehydratase [Streptomyces humidus]|uniref:Actinorhodin polyketide synthase bifunctional cyclase/dehydratase n=2 Tax=Streptomyces humidus TaxID=52259 RepID=A0A918FZ30_9ACTN|nr:actinorhodin polyketide synthase bifunctional cyclase/dehydratase [Streptomyces humidus]